MDQKMVTGSQESKPCGLRISRVTGWKQKSLVASENETTWIVGYRNRWSNRVSVVVVSVFRYFLCAVKEFEGQFVKLSKVIFYLGCMYYVLPIVIYDLLLLFQSLTEIYSVSLVRLDALTLKFLPFTITVASDILYRFFFNVAHFLWCSWNWANFLFDFPVVLECYKNWPCRSTVSIYREDMRVSEQDAEWS